MATYKKYTNKKGEATYYIRAYDGYDSAGKQIERCTKWKPSPGMTEKQIQKELQRQLVHFDDEVKKGLVLDGNIKFQVYSETWLENSQLAPKTKECYIILLQKINQALGHIRLNKFQKHHM